MIDKEKIAEVIGPYIDSQSLFLVSIEISRDNDIEVTVDSEERVDLSHCIEINNIIVEKFDRENEDYSLTVTSAGLDQPFKVLRQYLKYIGKEVEIVLRSGGKMKAVLEKADNESIEISAEKSVKVEGKKKREKILERTTLKLTDVKSTRPVINFK
ncbi:MAG: ribosome assembly cofactor RimP [Bacteroidales bacterium]|jgi:ribosome maturation factor RimP|nr:ribosome assembly cofactor RimP [Bacteroidales bacterium]